jgi:serine/threonine protein phosphatase PrpC
MAAGAQPAAAGTTDPGLERDNNEDRFYCDPAHGVFFVVDGVGGHAAGERAADIAFDVLRTRLIAPGAIERRLREAITEANNEIFRQAARHPEWHGMACVLTALVLDGGQAVVGHVGDTRLYKLRAGRIQKLTRDHSPVGEREDDRELSELEAMRHPRRNEVYRDVGSERHAASDDGFVDVIRVPFEADAALLLCSDGLTDYVTSGGIREIVEDLAGNSEAVVQGLVQAANRAGGKDNVTAVYVEGPRFVSGEDTRDLSPRRAAVAPARGPDPPDRSGGGRSRWRLMTLVVLLLVTIGVSAYELRKRWTPFDGVPGFASGPRQLVVAPGGSIGEALRQARPGDEVIVEPGEYREALSLRAGVRVRGRHGRAAAIRLPAGAAEGTAVSAEDIHDAALSGFRILGDAATPLGTGVLVRNAGVVLQDLEISGARHAAVDVAGEADASLLGSLVHDNPGAGLVVRSGASPRVEHNTFRRNGASPESQGPIFIEPGTQPLFQQNVFVGIAPASLAVPSGASPADLTRDNIFMNPSSADTPRSEPRRPAAAPGRQSRQQRLRPERGAEPPSESEREPSAAASATARSAAPGVGPRRTARWWGPASTEKSS